MGNLSIKAKSIFRKEENKVTKIKSYHNKSRYVTLKTLTQPFALLFSCKSRLPSLENLWSDEKMVCLYVHNPIEKAKKVSQRTAVTFPQGLEGVCKDSKQRVKRILKGFTIQDFSKRSKAKKLHI